MGRILSSIAIFAGWASIPLGAFAGLAASKFLGLNAVESLPTTTVYGMSAAVILWLFVAATLLTAVPLAVAMFSVSPPRSVYATATVMAVTGVALVPDELGRVFGFPILVGAAAIVFGGQLLKKEAAAAASAAASSPGRPQTWVFDAIGLSDDERPGPQVAPGPAVMSSAAAPAVGTWPESPAVAQTATTRRKRAGKAASDTVADMNCQWCSGVVPAGATMCPTCNAPFEATSTHEVAVAGVTEISPSLRAYADAARRGKKGPSLLRMIFNDTPVPQTIDAPPPSDDAALRPPSPELRAEMARLDAEIASGKVAPAAEPAGPLPDAKAAPLPDAAADATADAAAAKATPKPRRRNPRT
jgi:hypothetical protein